MPHQIHCLIACMFLATCAAWSSPGKSRIATKKCSQDINRNLASPCHRRDALQSMVTTLIIASSSFTLPTPANADVTNKVASSTALRSLTRAQTQLPIKLLPPAQSNNFRGVRTALREPPFDTLRKDMLTLVRGGEDGPKADVLRLAYAQLIKSLEAIDATSSLGMQGRTKDIDAFTLILEYEEVVKAMELFIKVAGEAAGIPLMEDSKQTAVGSIDARSGKVTERVI